jgi:formylmethanofuran:tetrahydromethanopterin formyltransferase
MSKLNLYYGTVKSATGGRHFMAWADSREHALNLAEAALTATEPVEGSVVGPIAKLPADVMRPGVFVEVTQSPAGLTAAPGAH